MSMSVGFRIDGIPQTKGSVRGFAFKRRNGKLGVAMTNDAGDKAKDWQHRIAFTARQQRPTVLEVEAVLVKLVFFLPRPKKHYRTGKRAGELRDDAPVFHVGKPDIDKLVRCALDGLKAVVYKDDSQVVHVDAIKHWCNNGVAPGARIDVGVVALEDN